MFSGLPAHLIVCREEHEVVDGDPLAGLVQVCATGAARGAVEVGYEIRHARVHRHRYHHLVLGGGLRRGRTRR